MIKLGNGELFGNGISLDHIREAELKVGRILSELRGCKETIDLLKTIIPPTDHAFLVFPALGGVRLTEDEFIPKNFLIPFDQYGSMMTPIYQFEIGEKL